MKRLVRCLVAAVLPISLRALDEHFDTCRGPELPKGWAEGSVDWRVGKGALTFCCGDYTVTRPPLAASDEAHIEATVRVERRGAKGWAAAGLTIRRDDENYWHLALVEAPPENGGGHFVELAEKLDGHWLAQNEGATRLTAKTWEGVQFPWKFEQPYRMRLSIGAAGIEGTVTELDGTVRSRIAYAFDRRAVSGGTPALCAALFSAQFDDVRAHTGAPRAEVLATAAPRYDRPGYEGVQRRASGFFRTERVDGRDWIIDPQGRGFYIVATDHVSYRGHWCEALGYSPYARVAAARYSNEANWAAATIDRLKTWGFNTLAAGHSPSLRHRGLPHIEFLAFGAGFAARDGLAERTTWTGFPNVFSPDWIRHCDLVARQHAAKQRDDPWLLGVFLDNELEWYGKSGQLDGLFEQAWLKPAGHTAKSAWIAFLQSRAGGIAGFNRAFGTGFADFEALARDVKPRRAETDEARAMARDFVRLVAEKYFQGCSDALRRHDPNHLNLGCRFAGRAPDVWDIAGRYCDVVSLNTYPRLDVDRGVPARVERELSAWQALTGRPMFITEWSFPALDAGLPSRHGAGMRVDTQAQRARCFSFFQEFLFRQPAFVGSSYFMYLDEPAQGISTSFPEDSNYGLINVDDVPYAEMVAAVSRVNASAFRMHAEGGFRPATIPDEAVMPAWSRGAAQVTALAPTSLPRIVSGLMEFAWNGVDAWTLSRKGKVVAEVHPLVHLVSGQDFWLRPSRAKLVGQGDLENVHFYDVEFVFQPSAADPRSARARLRYWIPKGAGGWIASQGQWVENNGSTAWRLGDLYHYLSPKPAGDPARIQPLNDIPSYYRQVPAWADRERGITIGACVLPGSRLNGEYWKDCPACFHSDLREIVDRDLAPGARWDASPDLAFFFTASEPTRAAHAAAADQILAE